MAVNLKPIDPLALYPVPGITIGIAEAGIRKANRKDLTVFVLEPGTTVAGVFTANRLCAAPVLVCREHLSKGEIRALVINTGNANAGTGETGLAAARQTCQMLAEQLGCAPEAVLPFSTGVIMEALPIERIERGLPQCLQNMKPDHWAQAAEAIMTTDTLPKAVSRQIKLGQRTITITGISKGAGMIKPNMATMLGFIATDAAISQSVLDGLVKDVADQSFNCISVDGDTSTNDSFVLMATGHAGNLPIAEASGADYVLLKESLTLVAQELAQAIVRDGEGATKFIAIQVQGGRTESECRAVGYAIAHSPLVKTAFFASDPNLGRILAAVGNAGIEDLDVSGIKLWLDNVLVATNGGRDINYVEEDGARVMKQAEITVRIDLARGHAQAVVWTCDLSYDYVKINADYRS